MDKSDSLDDFRPTNVEHFLLNKSDKIRQAFKDLRNPLATNRAIAERCEQNYGFLPSAQLITSAIGSQSDRRGRLVNMQQTMEVRRCCRRSFGNDWKAMAIAVDVCSDDRSN